MALKALKMPKKPLRKLVMPEKPPKTAEKAPERYPNIPEGLNMYACWPFWDSIGVTFDGEKSYWYDTVTPKMSEQDFYHGDDARADFAMYLLNGEVDYINFTLTNDYDHRWTVKSNLDDWEMSLWCEPEQIISLALWHQYKAAKDLLSSFTHRQA